MAKAKKKPWRRGTPIRYLALTPKEQQQLLKMSEFALDCGYGEEEGEQSSTIEEIRRKLLQKRKSNGNKNRRFSRRNPPNGSTKKVP